MESYLTSAIEAALCAYDYGTAVFLAERLVCEAERAIDPRLTSPNVGGSRNSITATKLSLTNPLATGKHTQSVAFGLPLPPISALDQQDVAPELVGILMDREHSKDRIDRIQRAMILLAHVHIQSNNYTKAYATLSRMPAKTLESVYLAALCWSVCSYRFSSIYIVYSLCI